MRLHKRCLPVALTHGQRDAAGGQDLPVGLPDAPARVLQVVHVHVHVPDIGHHDGLVRRRPGAAVVGPQQGRLHPDVAGTKPVVVQEMSSVIMLTCTVISL